MPTKQTFTAGQVLTAQQLSDLQDYIGVVQVKSTAKLDVFTTTSATYVDVTGLSVTITPTSATNKILIIAQVTVGFANNNSVGHFRFSGGNSVDYVGPVSGSSVRGVFGGLIVADTKNFAGGMSMMFLDSPATTSATTYVVQTRRGASSSTIRVNESAGGSSDENTVSGASSITVFEVTP